MSARAISFRVDWNGKARTLDVPQENVAAEIRMTDYPGAINESDVETFGVKATLITSLDIEEDIVYAVTKEVFENLDAFKKLHPSYAGLTREGMLEGISAPIHPGAMKYYKEVGLK